MIGTPRRTCRGRPMVCPGPCNHRRQKRLEKKAAETPYWHSCFHYGKHGDEGEDYDDDDDEDEDDGMKKCAGLGETATMTTDVRVIDVALSQITIYVEETGEECCPRPGSGKSYQAPKKKVTPSCQKECRAKCSSGRVKKALALPPSISKMKDWTKGKRIPDALIYIVVIVMYGLVHAIIGLIAKRGALYEAFLSSQICGFVAYLIWRTTGTIPL